MEQTIKIYNSLKRQKELFEPINPPQVKMYVCGPTVYDEPHIGHARSAYIFDVIRRYLIYKGYKVMFVRNVTDVDDKIIDKAKKECPDIDLINAAKEVSDKYLNTYHNDMKQLGIMDPDVEPKATEFISSQNPSMQRFISHLIERGVAYVAGGDVYFDIKKAKDYGKLSNQSIDKMESGARVLSGENKNDPLDFALWKAAKEGEPSWDSPWGKGRPGWHIECSVMSSDILGDKFDIHGGGIDLIFPHHENEIAQSEGAGKKFAKYWIHHGLLTINGQKMSKSLGNFVTIKDALRKYHPDALKLFYLQAHYSNPIDYAEKKMEEAKSTYKGLVFIFGNEQLWENSSVELKVKEKTEIDSYISRFEKAMDDNFNTPQALAELFKMVSYCNTMQINEQWTVNAHKLKYATNTLYKLTEILGLSIDRKEPLGDPRLRSGGYESVIEESMVDVVNINKMVEERTKLKKEKRFTEADKIRETLEAKGVVLEDKKDGKTYWRWK